MTILPIPRAPELAIEPHEAGLGALVALVEGAEQAFPLSEVVVRGRIVGNCARTVVEQVFENPFSEPLEAVHLFPLPEDGAVVELVLSAGEITVVAECREKAEAQQVFQQAREAGHRAALLTQERDDVHTLRVTRIPPGEAIRVRIVVVERLDVVDGRYRWRFPTVIAPRYLPGQPVRHDGPSVLPATDRVPDADRLQPPVRLSGGTRFDLEVEIDGPVRQLACAQHAFQIELGESVRVAPSASSTLDRDFVLAFSTADADDLATRAWTDGAFTLVTVEPPSAAVPPALPRDAVFIVDISGSMGGTKMAAAKLALKTAVHGLVRGDRFRLVAFDDRVEAMSPDLLQYDDRSLARADAWIDALHARGGTEMLAPIVEGLSGDRPAGRVRTVLFITDGQAWNTAELLAAVANRAQGARFFTFGIDSAVNGALLKRLARAGGGTCELATPSDDIEGAVAALEARFGDPLLENVQLEGLQSARMAGSAVFSGRPATLLVEGAPDTVIVCGRGVEGDVRHEVSVHRTGFALGPLWARERVAALQDRLVLKPFEEEALRPEILRIALAHHIASRFTAFVAVDRSRVVDGTVREVVQPVELPHQWEAEEGGEVLRSSGVRTRGGYGGGGAPQGPPPPAAPAPMTPMASAAPRRRQSRKRDSNLLGRVVDTLSQAVGGRADSAPADAVKESRKAEVAREESPADIAGSLARSQSADGSFGGDVLRTAAALLALIWLGHTRRVGTRRRTVTKAAKWLKGRTEPQAQLALAALTTAEAGIRPTPDAAWAALHSAEGEGRALQRVTAA